MHSKKIAHEMGSEAVVRTAQESKGKKEQPSNAPHQMRKGVVNVKR